MKVTFFRSPSELRKWFEKNHATTQEFWVGFYKLPRRRAAIALVNRQVEENDVRLESPGGLEPI
jgi:hypothetical protein